MDDIRMGFQDAVSETKIKLDALLSDAKFNAKAEAAGILMDQIFSFMRKQLNCGVNGRTRLWEGAIEYLTGDDSDLRKYRFSLQKAPLFGKPGIKDTSLGEKIITENTDLLTIEVLKNRKKNTVTFDVRCKSVVKGRLDDAVARTFVIGNNEIVLSDNDYAEMYEVIINQIGRVLNATTPHQVVAALTI
jgi:hypothetical protein